MNKTKISKSRLPSLVLLLMILASFSGCASLQAFGRFVPDVAVTAAFNKAQINSDYNYYLSGSELYPRSILGLHKSYELRHAELWKKVKLESDVLKHLTANMLQRSIRCRPVPVGFAVIDNRGQKIGEWYSTMVTEISIEMLDNRQVIIFQPNDRNYDCYEERR